MGGGIGVIVAAAPEAEAILADPAFGWAPEEPGLWRAGASRGEPLRLVLSGAGKVLATWAASRLLPEAGILLALGTAGGLGGEAVGSLWLVREFVEHDYDVSAFGVPPGVTLFEAMDGPVIATADEGTVERARLALARAGLEAGECRLASGDSFIAEGGRARDLAARTGARLVDMECAAVAKVCALRARDADGAPPPFLALKAVSDNADHAAAGSWADRARASSRGLAAFLKAFALG